MNEKTRSGEIALSVVIPVFNGEAVLTGFFDRLYPVLDGLGQGYEAVFVDDASRDRSATLLRQQHRLRPDATRVVYLRGHAGRHAALLAGFAACAGRRIVTLDADLRNPPEEIPRLLAEMDRGHDYVGSIRRRQQRPGWLDIASEFASRLRERLTGVRLTDPDCMPRAYDREVVEAVLATNEGHGLIPALAYRYAANPTEIPVEQEAPGAGESKHRRYGLIRLNLDLVTGFSLVPLQIFSLIGIGAGMGIAMASFACLVYLALRWLLLGPGPGGPSGLFGLLFFLAGVILFGIGLLGQYLGRILEQGWGRPPYPVREELAPRPRPRA